MSQSSQCNLIALALAAVHLALEIIKWETEMTNKPEIQTQEPPGNAKQMASKRPAQGIATVFAGGLLTASTVVASFLWAPRVQFASWCPCKELRGINRLERPLKCRSFVHPLTANREIQGLWRTHGKVRTNTTFLWNFGPTLFELFIELSPRYHWCVLSGRCFQHAPNEIPALFQYVIILLCQENLFKRSGKIKFGLNRSWHNGNEILGCPISKKVWVYEISCSNSFSVREENPKLYCLLLYPVWSAEKTTRTSAVAIWTKQCGKTPCRAPSRSILSVYPHRYMVYWKRKQLLWNRFQTANPSRFALLPSRICF